MPEPVSKTEIEDVLSSIRRLVADNAGAIRRDSEAVDTAQGEKLVLTPAFRVDSDADGDAQDAEHVAGQDLAQEPESVPQTVQGLAETETVEPDPIALREPDLAEAAPQIAEPEAGAWQAEDATDDATALADDDAMSSREEARPLSPLEQRIAELEAVVSRSAIEFEPDGSEEDALPDAVLFHHRANAAEEAMAPEAARAPDLQADDDAPGQEGPHAGDEPDWEAARTDPAAFATEIAPEIETEPASAPEAEAALEPEIEAEPVEVNDGETGPSDWQHDAPSHDSGAAASVHEAEPDTDPVAAEVATDGADWEDVGEVSDDESGEAVIDEDALREMVAHMVREELQGSVGERITHNVRRMVRREIARALSLQQVE